MNRYDTQKKDQIIETLQEDIFNAKKRIATLQILSEEKEMLERAFDESNLYEKLQEQASKPKSKEDIAQELVNVLMEKLPTIRGYVTLEKVSNFLSNQDQKLATALELTGIKLKSERALADQFAEENMSILEEFRQNYSSAGGDSQGKEQGKEQEKMPEVPQTPKKSESSSPTKSFKSQKSIPVPNKDIEEEIIIKPEPINSKSKEEIYQ